MRITADDFKGFYPSPTHLARVHVATANARFCPFATNLQVQVLTCPAREAPRQIRIILNDAAVPLTGIRGCAQDDEGLCSLDKFVESVGELVGEVDFAAEGVCAGV